MIKPLIAVCAMAVVAANAVALEGDIQAGEQKAQSCAACHGPQGNSVVPSFPKLAGQGLLYNVKQLKDIKSGLRPVPEMAGLLDNLDEQDFADIGAYYAAQTPTIERADPELVARGEQIYRGGIHERGVPACSGCHAPAGEGNAPAVYPRLAGQYADYTASQLRGFRAAADGREGRANDGDDARTMRSIAFRMSDSEIEAVSSYISGLFMK